MLASSADERQDANGEAAVSVSWFVEEVELVVCNEQTTSSRKLKQKTRRDDCEQSKNEGTKSM